MPSIECIYINLNSYNQNGLVLMLSSKLISISPEHQLVFFYTWENYEYHRSNVVLMYSVVVSFCPTSDRLADKLCIEVNSMRKYSNSS